jgi:hypothetical protein
MGSVTAPIFPSASASPTSVEVKDFAADHDANLEFSSAPRK